MLFWGQFLNKKQKEKIEFNDILVTPLPNQCFNHVNQYYKERKSEQAHIPHTPQLLENAVYNEWQFQALLWGNRTENQFNLSCTK